MGQLNLRGRVSAAGISGLGIGVLLVWGTASLSEASRAFPQLIGYLMIGLGILDVLRMGIAGRNAAEKAQSDQSDARIDLTTIWKFIGATLLYVVLIPIIGFYVTTFAFLVGGIRLLGVRQLWAYILVPVITTGILYYGFNVQLRTPLPGGILI